MNKQEKIKDLMNPYFKKNRELYYELSMEDINYLEIKYQVKLPESFIWYLTKYHFGGLSIDIPSKAIHSNINCLELLNDNYRDDKYPKGLFIISHVDEYEYCLDTNRLQNGECPVVSYSIHDNDGILDRKPNFCAFLIDQINNSIDNEFFQ